MCEIHDPLELSELFPNLKSIEVCMGPYYDRNEDNNASLPQNWKKLEIIKEVGYCSYKKHHGGCFLTMMLLETPSCIRSLTSITLNFSEEANNSLPTLIDQLKHASSIKSLTLKFINNLDYKTLDLLHENTPNLEHLKIFTFDCLFVKEANVTEYRSLSMNMSAARNLRSFSLDILSTTERTPLYLMEYICRKYTNLISVSVSILSFFEHGNNIDIRIDILKNAFLSNWIQLKKFDMHLGYLSADILRAMDNNNICIEELKVYISGNEYTKQFRNLAHSKQGKIIQKLTVIDDERKNWRNRNKVQDLAYFLQSLNRDNCHLKEIDIELLDPEHDELTPIKIIDCIPSLQRLSMCWNGATNRTGITYNRTIRLTHLDLKFDHAMKPTTDCYTIRYIKDMLYNLPFLQSFSLSCFQNQLRCIALDFKENPKLEYFQFYDRGPRNNIRIVQNRQTKWYIPNQNSLKEEPPNDGRMFRTIYFLFSIRRLIINKVEYCL
jgi:hypothetical protein